MPMYKPSGPQITRANIRKALDNLDAEDQATIKKTAKDIEARVKGQRSRYATNLALEQGRTAPRPTQAGFGKQSAYELLSKLGMLMCAAEKDLPLDLRKRATMAGLVEEDD